MQDDESYVEQMKNMSVRIAGVAHWVQVKTIDELLKAVCSFKYRSSSSLQEDVEIRVGEELKKLRFSEEYL